MPDSTTTEPPALSAPYTLEYPYHRSTGAVLGRFLAGLRDGIILGSRTNDGRVLVPAAEYDEHGDATGDLVEVSASGIVTTWTWIAQPRTHHPRQHPFAFALIKLDGADTALLHAVDAGDESLMRTEMRVTAHWRNERDGSINDIECFVPDVGAQPAARVARDAP